MSELRSFLIGVVIAGVLLGIVALALGAFSSEGEEAPRARQLGTPLPSATVRATTRPSTTALPTAVTTQAATSPTAAATAPATSPTPAGPSPTPEPTNTPVPQPTVNPVAAYVNEVSVIVTDLGAQIDYLVGAGSTNPAGSGQAANTVKSLAGRLQGLSAPACHVNGHATLSQGAAAANAAADQLLAALGASNANAVATALSTLSSAKSILAQGAATVSSTTC